MKLEHLENAWDNNLMESMDNGQIVEIITEASRRRSAFVGAILGYSSVAPVLATSLMLGAGSSLATLGIVTAAPAVAIGGALTGAMFAKGKQRTLYDKIKKKTKILSNYIERMDLMAQKITDTEEWEKLKVSVQLKTEIMTKEISMLQDQLKQLMAQGKGDSGLFRKSFQKVLYKDIRKGQAAI